jgi:P4 family phage/plasmid primase-like protien
MTDKYKFVIKKGKTIKYNNILKVIKPQYSQSDMPLPDMAVHNVDVFITPNKKLYDYLIGIGYVVDLNKFKLFIKAKKQKSIKDKVNSNMFISEEGAFLYTVFSEWLYKESDHYFIRIRQTDDIYYYRDGIYIPFGESFIEEIIQHEIGWEAIITKNHVSEIVAYMKRLCTCEIDVMTSHNNMITCKNGVVDLRTKTLSAHTPKNYAFHKIPWDYVPNAECIIVDELINRLIPDKAQSDKVYNMIGYGLIDSYIYNKIFFLFGPPGTGKTSITNVVTNLLGIDSVSDIRLDDLIKRPFMRVGLLNSCINFCGDASNTPIKDASIIKVLSGDGRMDVDMKNVAMPIKLQNRSKLVIDTNNMPEFDKRDLALHRRFVKVPFNVIVEESEKSANYMDVLSTQGEMEGLLVKAIDAAHVILTTENPFKTMSIEEEQHDYEMQIWNVVDDFIATHIQIIPEIVDPDVFTTQGDIWVQFKEFTKSKDISAVDLPKVIGFNKQIRKKCDLGDAKGKTVKGVTKRGYHTVKLINVDVELSGFDPN